MLEITQRARAELQVFEQEGRHILLVDGSAARLVDGLVLDVVDGAQGRRFGLRQG